MRLLALVALAGVLALLAPVLVERAGRAPDTSAAERPAGPGELPAYGLSAWENGRITPRQLDLIRESGAPLYRFNMITTFVGREGTAQASRYDRLVRDATVRGITLLPVLMRLRTVQEPEAPRSAAEHSQWRARVGALAARYGAGGTFWSENPDLPYRPIRAWEVWNEPNFRPFWGRRPDPLAYRRILAEARAALREADPETRVVAAGLAWRRGGARFLARVLEGGGDCLADAVAIHPYGASPSQSIDYLAEARTILDRSGAAKVPLWTTEVGWRVARRGRYAVPTEADQGRFLARFAAEVERRRGDLRLGPVIAFVLRDRVRPSSADSFGLLRQDHTPRPAWEAWSAGARAAEPVPLPPQRGCGAR